MTTLKSLFEADGGVTTYLQTCSRRVEEELDRILFLERVPYKQLLEAARYSLLGGGKRIRPILTIAAAEAFNIPLAHSLRTGCAIELIHTYSLIHDDLPCMDNDDYRRGKPSLHKAFPEAIAVLAGDFLLTKAFELLATDPLLAPTQKLELIQLLSKSAGSCGMIGGQVMDIEAEGETISLDALKNIHRHKTGALIRASILSGAIIGNANAKQLAILAAFAEDLGLAFQIIDDILDVIGDLKKAGSDSSDIRNGKSTYVSLLGMEQAREHAEALSASALASLESLSLKTEALRFLTQHLLCRHS